MLIGSGLLARAFAEFAGDADFVIFAAGVSDSRETRQEAFAREASRLRDALAETKGVFVYFGTCSKFDPSQRDTPYVRHKDAMEALIGQSARDWRIFRLPQVVGLSDNPGTLINFMVSHLRAGAHFEVWANATRSIIADRDVARIAKHILAQGGANRAVNFWPGPTRPLDIARALETILGVQGQYEIVEKGAAFDVPADEFRSAAAAIGLDIGAGYGARVLRDVYGN